MAEELVPAAAAHDVDCLDVQSREPAGVVDRSSEGHRQAVEDASNQRRPRGRHRLIRVTAIGGDALRHVSGRQETRIVHVDDAATSRLGGEHLAVPGVQIGQIQALAPSFPPPHRFLERPQTQHVSEVADSSVYAQLVGEVRLTALLVESRPLEFDADERPGPAGDIRESLVLRGYADYSGSGVVGSDGGQYGSLGQPCIGHNLGPDRTKRVPGVDEGWQDSRWQT